MFKIPPKNAAFFLCAAFLIPLFTAYNAQALRLTVKRVIFEGSVRSENIIIINSKDTPETYRIGWRPMYMNDKGRLIAFEDQAETIPKSYKKVEDMIRYAPRRITVDPRSSQQIRLLLRRPGDLPDGEYRNHLYIMTERLDNENKTKDGNSLTALPGISIPVFVRKGNLNVAASFNRLSFRDIGNAVKIDLSINRQGNKSLYGELELVCNLDQGDEYVLHTISNLAIYTDTALRAQTIKVLKNETSVPCKALYARLWGNTAEDRILLAETHAAPYTE